MTDDFRAGVLAAMRAFRQEFRRCRESKYRVSVQQFEANVIEAIEMETGVYRDGRGAPQHKEARPRAYKVGAMVRVKELPGRIDA